MKATNVLGLLISSQINFKRIPHDLDFFLLTKNYFIFLIIGILWISCNKFPGLFYIYLKYININAQAAAVEVVELTTKNYRFKSCEGTKLRLEY